MKLPPFTLATYSLIHATLLRGVTATPTPPGLSYIGTANISITSPFPVGPGPFGDRNVYAITGGSFAGPSFSATIPNFGGDWGLGDPLLGNFYIDARYQLHTPDGADILVEANGPQQPGGELHTRVRFETGHPTYAWLNKVVASAIVTPAADLSGITIDMWKIETPVTKPGGGKRKGKGKGY